MRPPPRCVSILLAGAGSTLFRVQERPGLTDGPGAGGAGRWFTMSGARGAYSAAAGQFWAPPQPVFGCRLPMSFCTLPCPPSGISGLSTSHGFVQRRLKKPLHRAVLPGSVALGVKGRRAETGVAQTRLHVPQVAAGVERVIRMRVAQPV